MPYVLQERRPDLDSVVKEMVALELTTSDIAEFLVYIAMEGDGWLVFTNKPEFFLEAVKTAGAAPTGDLNYVLFKYGKYHIKPSYNNYKTYIGAICKAINKLEHIGGYDGFVDEYREAAAEIRRRILGPYEDKKINENGDV